MTDPEPAEKIVPRILKQYSERPRGWHIMNTPRGEVLVLSSDSAFQLKLIPLNPREFTGAGVELPESNDIVDSIRTSPEFGLRPLSEVDLQGIRGQGDRQDCDRRHRGGGGEEIGRAHGGARAGGAERDTLPLHAVLPDRLDSDNRAGGAVSGDMNGV